MTAPRLSTCFLVSLFSNKNDATPKVETMTSEALRNKVKNPVIRSNKDGGLFSPSYFNPAHRANENVVQLSLLVFDFDHNTSFVEVVEWEEKLKVRGAVH